MALEQFTNIASTTLNGAITSGATSLVVASASGFPTSAPFRILVFDNANNPNAGEFMLVTAVSGATWTVTRAVEGPNPAASHVSGASVTHLFTAGSMQALQQLAQGSAIAMALALGG